MNQWRQVILELNRYGYTIDEGQVAFISEEELSEINKNYPSERVKMLTEAKPFHDPLIIMTIDEQSQKDREADDEKFRFMRV